MIVGGVVKSVVVDVYGGIQRKGAKPQRCKEAKQEERVAQGVVVENLEMGFAACEFTSPGVRALGAALLSPNVIHQKTRL